MGNLQDYLNVYRFTTTLPGSGKEIEFKPLTTGQIKKLLIYENETDPVVIEKALDELISSSILTEKFNISDLYLEDRLFLLVEIRKKSKGETYKFTYKCDKCNSQVMNSIDLNTLNVKKLPEKCNPIVELNENISLELNHITRGKQKEAFSSYKKVGTQTQRMAEMSMLTQAAAIKSIITPEGEDSNPSIDDRMYILNEIPTSVFDKIREWFDDNEFGIDLSFNMVCTNCGDTERVNIDLDNFFF